jgi:hypothetical protein
VRVAPLERHQQRASRRWPIGLQETFNMSDKRVLLLANGFSNGWCQRRIRAAGSMIQHEGSF